MSDFSNQFSPISLAELNSVWLNKRRFDRKYVLRSSDLINFVENFNQLKILSMDSQAEFAYSTSYFDTDDFDFYRDHCQKRKRRVKIRIRRYLDSAKSQLEIKYRSGTKQTEKFILPDVNEITHESSQFINETLQNLFPDRHYFHNFNQNTLTEKIATNFSRQTFVTMNTQERLTVDSGLVIKSNNGILQSKPEIVLVEVKSLAAQSVLAASMTESGFNKTSFSKYAAGVDLLIKDRPRVHSVRRLTEVFGPLH